MTQRKVVISIWILFCCLCIGTANADEWKVGTAREKITPTKPIWMAGYARRDKPADGKLTELWAKVLVIEDRNDDRVILVTLDLIGIDRELSQSICAALEKRGIRREQIALCASHTHTGPVVAKNLRPMHFELLDQANQKLVAEYAATLENKVVAAVDRAFKNTEPAKLAWENGTASFAVNRRNNSEANVPQLRKDKKLKGPVDHDVPVLSVRDSDDRLKAVVFGYACHSTVLSFFKWSGDYPGFAQIELEKKHPDCLAMFWAGCGADQNPLPRRKVELAQAYGKRLADAVDRVLQNKMRPVSGTLKAIYREIDLPLGKLPTKADLELNAKSSNRFEAARAKMLLAQLAAGTPLAKTYPYPIQTWRLGDQVQWIFLGGEVVVDYSIRLKTESRQTKTWVTAYANDVMAYIPSRRVLGEGGYEGAGAMVYYGLPTVWAPEIEKLIVDEVHAQLKTEGRSVREQETQKSLRIPPKSVEQSLKSFEVVDGFEIQLVAAEPQIRDPVAIAYDEKGLLYVAEFLKFPTVKGVSDRPDGRIGVLRDSDNDGVYETSHVFADGIAWPTGICPWKGGVFVIAAPDLWYLKDTDGDHVADVRQKWFTGFGFTNEEGTANNLIWGLDHWIYGAGSLAGGRIFKPDDPNGKSIDIAGSDFRFHPISGEFQAISGAEQFGNSFDDWNNRFICQNSKPAVHVVLPARYLARNPFTAPSAVRRDIWRGNRVYRNSAAEPWRLQRTKLRLSQNRRWSPPLVQHDVFTATSGATILRGDAFPNSVRGNLFVGDVQSNLVHRRKLVPAGVSFDSIRIEQQTEFVRSTDNWFRPVNLYNAPDGSLNIVDMYREVIETPDSLPETILRQLDLDSGNDRGRIYRLTTAGFKAKKRVRLDLQSTTELVSSLESSNGWTRETAQRLLLERRDRNAIEPLQRMITDCESDVARLHAMYCLSNLVALSDESLLSLLKHPSAGIREHAIRLSESRINRHSGLRQRVLELSDDPEARVRFQVSFSLGELNPRESRRLTVVVALADICNRDPKDPWIRAAVLSSVVHNADLLIARLFHRPEFFDSRSNDRWLADLSLIVGSAATMERISALADRLAKEFRESKHVRNLFVSGLAKGMQNRGKSLRGVDGISPLIRQAFGEMIRSAETTAANQKSPLKARQLALQNLVHAEFRIVESVARQTLQATQPAALQIATIRTLAAFETAAAADILISNWSALSPAVRGEAIEALFARKAWTRRLLTAISNKTIPRAALDSTRVQMLARHRDTKIRELAHEVLESPSDNRRSEVLSKYQAALKKKGDADRGQKIFSQHCATCHAMNGKGFAVGPDLATVRKKTADELLIEILDPNRQVQANYLGYVVLTLDGRQLSGVITNESPHSITLQRAENVKQTILRKDIDEIQSTGVSLMPEGLEAKIDSQQMSDLLEFLKGRR